MNKKTVVPFVLVLSLVAFTSCFDWFGTTGKGNIVTEIRPVTEFQSIELLTSADVEIQKGDTFMVEVSDYENIIQNLSVVVANRNLLISVTPNSAILKNSKAHVKIIMPDSLISVSITGSGDIKLDAAFKDLKKFFISGSGSILATQNLNIAGLDASILGSGNITAQGKVKALKALISGSGNMFFEGLVAETADCTLTGSGNMFVNVTTALNAKLTGSGNIEYSGSPTITAETVGSGVVRPK